MKKTWTIMVALLLVALAGISVANKPNQGEGINITIAPKTLVLDRITTCVTVHSNIPIGTVYRDSLLLEGISPVLTKADAMGDLVCKFTSQDLKAILSTGPVSLTLTGILKDGEMFAASAVIVVK